MIVFILIVIFCDVMRKKQKQNWCWQGRRSTRVHTIQVIFLFVCVCVLWASTAQQHRQTDRHTQTHTDTRTNKQSLTLRE
jgi:NADH:ubiquinone oxidoreductase subunit 6 (subunit J)